MGQEKHILVAEDSAATNRVICHILESAGFKVTAARSGQRAWELLKDHAFDLVVSDFQMPGMTGGELRRRMQQDARLARIPVILLTAKGYELDKTDGKLSVVAIMPKPFSPRELLRTVAAVFEPADADEPATTTTVTGS